VLIFLLTGFSHVTLAQQSSLKLIAEVPVQFGIGYEGQVSKHFSVGGSLGVLTKPNSNIIIEVLRFIDVDEPLVLIIEDAFQLGIVAEVNANYNFKRNYVGVFTQMIGLQAGNASPALIDNYFQVDVNNYPVLAGKTNIAEKNLRCRTRLYQAGLLFGHRFPLKGNRFVINAELGLSANIGSTSSVTGENHDLSRLNDRLNVSLDTFYKEYAFIPSCAVMLVYKLRMKKLAKQ
jgi:hypothetical protein